MSGTATITHSIALGRRPLWGDLFAHPTIEGGWVLPLRERQLAALLVDATGKTEVLACKAALNQPRLRAITRAGLWLVTSPDAPNTVWAIDPVAGKIRWQTALPGRFDPDTRLAVRVSHNDECLIAGCGVAGLQRLDAAGQLMVDYYALQPAHQQDFAWRGIVACAEAADGTLYVCDRNMYGVVLVVDPHEGHVRDIGIRQAGTMTRSGVGLAEPCWVECTPAGELVVLELATPAVSRWTAAGVRDSIQTLPFLPWHYLAQEQVACDAAGALWLITQQRGLGRLLGLGQ